MTDELAVQFDKDVLDFFPKPSFRLGQKDALLKAQEAIRAGRNVLIEAPVGTGKSVIAVTLAKWAGGAVITTPLNILVDQYHTEFDQERGIAVVKGRKNYPCFQKPIKNPRQGEPTHETAEKGLCYDEDIKCECPYGKAREKAKTNDVVITNLYMASVAPWIRFCQEGHREFPLLVIDEAHNLEPSVSSMVSIVLPPEDFDDEPPTSENFEAHLAWLTEKAMPLAQLQYLSLKKQAKDADLDERGMKALKHWKWLFTGIERIIDDFKEYKEPWLVTFTQKEKGGEMVPRVTYRPITGTRFIKKLLYSLAPQVVLLSATPPTPIEVGLENIESIVVPMSFPADHRPIILSYAGSMNKEKKFTSAPLLAKRISELAKGATIVHAHSYGIAKMLHDGLQENGRSSILQNSFSRNGSLENWFQHPESIFVSVNMAEGLNLKDDLCRTQFLAKVPWPDFGDPLVKARKAYLGDDWMVPSVVRAVVQAYGRAVRSETDWANFYIIDSSFAFLYYKHNKLFPQWFRQAVGLPAVVK